MLATSLPPRSESKKQYTWNAESVFTTPQDWEAEVTDLLASLPRIGEYRGRLKESPDTLAKAFEILEELTARSWRVVIYAGFSASVDTTNQAAAAMNSRADSLRGQLAAAAAFVNTELLTIGKPQLLEWVNIEPRLAHYSHHFQNLFRRQEHLRSSEVEEVLGMLSDPFSGPGKSSRMLTSADMKIPSGMDSSGNPLEISEAMVWKIMGVSDRRARQTVWDHYHDTLYGFKNTLAANLSNSIKQNVFLSRVRRYKSALEMMLSEHGIPVSVYHNLIDTFQKNLPIWHRYFELRRRALGLQVLQPYDLWAPLVGNNIHIPFEKAVDLTAEGLLPLGKEYVGILRNGCLEDRWVDVYPNQGKRAGAFSEGSPGTHPFIMMSYTEDIFSLSTLAHELGHSMHSYLTWQHQPFVYTDYSLFAAEVASNFHQAMVRAHLLRSNPEREFQVAVIEEAMANFYRYFFIMPTLARFELETHSAVERNQPLSSETLINLMADLFTEAYGGRVEVNRNRVGMTWARFGHLFSDYYVYAYATGIAGAHALAGRILQEEPGAVEDYLGFLKAGCSGYPLDVLKRAGVDLTSPAPVEAAMGIMSGYVDRLEQLLK